jgi:hypothetical protein
MKHLIFEADLFHNEAASGYAAKVGSSDRGDFWA